MAFPAKSSSPSVDLKELPPHFQYGLHSLDPEAPFSTDCHPEMFVRFFQKHFLGENNHYSAVSRDLLALKIRLLHKALCPSAQVNAFREHLTLLKKDDESSLSLENYHDALQSKRRSGLATDMELTQEKILSRYLQQLRITALPKIIKLLQDHMPADMLAAINRIPLTETRSALTSLIDKAQAENYQEGAILACFEKLSPQAQCTILTFFDESLAVGVHNGSVPEANLKQATRTIDLTVQGRLSQADLDILREIYWASEGCLCVHPKDLAREYQIFLEEFHRRLQIEGESPYAIAAWVMVEYPRIFPFDDGHGRTSRALVQWLFVQNNMMPVIFQDYERLCALLLSATRSGSLAPVEQYLENCYRETVALYQSAEYASRYPVLSEDFYDLFAVIQTAHKRMCANIERLGLPRPGANLMSSGHLMTFLHLQDGFLYVSAEVIEKSCYPQKLLYEIGSPITPSIDIPAWRARRERKKGSYQFRQFQPHQEDSRAAADVPLQEEEGAAANRVDDDSSSAGWSRCLFQ